MILVGQFDSPFTRRIGVVLHSYGLPFTRDTRSIFGDAEAISQINPLTRIPALLLDDGTVLIDSGAICEYLDELVGPARALMADNGPVRRAMLQDIALIEGTLEKVIAVVYERFFHTPDQISSAWLSRCLGQIDKGLTALESRCDPTWFHGPAFSHVDILMACAVGYIRLRLPEVFDDAARPRLAALSTRCEGLPAFIAAGISPNETMPASS
jgi:glutathione S-transferase